MDDCLRLLKGPQDESRFVGLLLATRLLPAGDDTTLKAVIDAVGFSFLERLLLPLKQPSKGMLDTEQNSQAEASCSLALAILSSCCRGCPALPTTLPIPILQSDIRSHEIAASEDLHRFFPLLLKVVNYGGINALFATKNHVDASGTSHRDCSAVEDALECLASAAGSSSQAQEILLAMDVLKSCTAVLKGPAVTRRAIACCLLLVQRLLTCRDERARSELLDNQVDQLADLVAALSGHLNILEVESSMDSTGDADTCEPDLAAIQLEALNALLHIFPLPSPGGRVEAVLRASADGQQWPRSTRAGVHTLLVARVGLVQRHAALTLAAAMVELLGPGWLVGEGRQGADRDAFFQALVEVVKVETAVLFHDITGPSHNVTSTSARTTAARDYRPVMSKQLNEDDDVAEDAESTANDPSCDQYAAAEGHVRLDAVDAAVRAKNLLPSCLSLLESSIAVLVLSIGGEASMECSSSQNEDAAVSKGIATRAMSSISQALETVVQYLEEASGSSSGGGDAAAGEPIALAAARLLGCFALEAPTVHEERIAKLIPFVLTVHGGVPGPAGGARFILPLLAAEAEIGEGDAGPAGSALRAVQDPLAIEALCSFVSSTAKELQSTAGSPFLRQGLESSLADAACVLLSTATRDPGILDLPPLSACLVSLSTWVQSTKDAADGGLSPALDRLNMSDDTGDIHHMAFLSVGCLAGAALAHACSSATCRRWAFRDCEAAAKLILRALQACCPIRPYGESVAIDLPGGSSSLDLWDRLLANATTCFLLGSGLGLVVRNNMWCHWAAGEHKLQPQSRRFLDLQEALRLLMDANPERQQPPLCNPLCL